MAQQEDDYIIFSEVGINSQVSTSINKQPIPGNYKDLYDELMQKCNPANFMHPYNKEKIDIANDIYEQITRHKDNKEDLILLRKRAMKELSITFSTIKLYNKLTKACNPVNFTGNSYDSKKLRYANELYSLILENADDIEKLEDLEREASDFIEIAEKRQREIEQKRISGDTEWKSVGFLCAIFLFVLFILFSMFALYNNSHY